MILPRLRYEDMTWPQLAEAAKQDPVLVQPIGAIEQHGPHLAVKTDTMQVHAIAQMASERAAEQIPLLLLPTIHWGFSTIQMDMPESDHDRFPGTITLTADIMMRLCSEIAQSLSRARFRHLVFLNGHGGNYQPLMTAARTIRDQTGLVVAVTNYWTFPDDALIKSIIEEGTIRHAAEWETSMHMALDDDTVDYKALKTDEKAQNAIKVNTGFANRDELGGKMYAAKVFFAEKNVDFSSLGVVGNPTLASREKGDRLIKHYVEAISRFMVEFKSWEYGAI